MYVLITGGAGFIGLHLTRTLLNDGHEIAILDNFLPQVHAGSTSLPSDIAPHVRLIRGDVADKDVLRSAVRDVDAVVQLAAETGTGQSMYQICRYERTNLGGSAVLYEVLTDKSARNVERIVIASSRAIYGEGAYSCDDHGVVYPLCRSDEDKRRGQFDPTCPVCSCDSKPVPTPETAPLRPSSYYGLTKQVQEQTALLFGEALRIPTYALRYQNVYGPGQSLQNPYTGILAVFSNLARTGAKLCVFEDGRESRDFVHIEDVVRATAACLITRQPGCHSLNVGSSERTSILEVANRVNSHYGLKSEVEISGAFRKGDIRHGIADLSLINSLIGYQPQKTFASGLATFLNWAENFEPTIGGYDRSLAELREKGLLREQH